MDKSYFDVDIKSKNNVLQFFDASSIVKAQISSLILFFFHGCGVLTFAFFLRIQLLIFRWFCTSLFLLYVISMLCSVLCSLMLLLLLKVLESKRFNDF